MSIISGCNETQLAQYNTRIERINQIGTKLTAQIKAGGLPSNHPVVVQYGQVAERFTNLVAEAGTPTSWLTGVLDCDKLIQTLNKVILDLEALGKSSSEATKTPNVVTPLTAGLDKSTGDCGWLCKAIWAAVIIGGVYVGYKVIVGRPLLGGHDDGEIPQSQLPQYAGGSRR